MACLLSLDRADAGLNNLSANIFGFAKTLAVVFFDFLLPFSDDFEVDRFRKGLAGGLATAEVETSLSGTFVVVVFGTKKVLAVSSGRG